MKKVVGKIVGIVATILIAASVAVAFVGCGTDEELRIYNWGYYMCDDVLDSFAEWYENETGRSIRVRQTSFTSNERMLRDIDQGVSFDIAVPSEYTVSKMLKEELLLPIDRDIVTNLDNIYGRLMDITDAATGRTSDTDNVYAMPYLWGTMGLMFDASMIRYEYIEYWGWSALFRPIPTNSAPTEAEPVVALTSDALSAFAADNRFLHNRIYMKDSVRDSLTAAQFHNRRDRLLTAVEQENTWDVGGAGHNILQEIFVTPPSANLATYETIFRNQRQMNEFFKFEVDIGMNEMMDNLANRGFMGVFWSCDAGYVLTENSNLAYHVPKLGGNVYVDAMVIPSTARNPVAANYFLYYINKFDPANPGASAAFRNMSAVGAPSAVEAAMEAFRDSVIANDGVANIYDEKIKDMFGDKRVGDRPTDMFVWEMYTNVIMFPHLYPGENILDRTSHMRDWGPSVEQELALMWSRVLVATSGCDNADATMAFVFVPLGLMGVGTPVGMAAVKSKMKRREKLQNKP